MDQHWEANLRRLVERTPDYVWIVGSLLLLLVIVLTKVYEADLWDWLELLIVPTVIAGGGIWFSRQQRERELENQETQRRRELEMDEQRAQDNALQSYFDHMSELLLDRALRNSQEEDEVRMVARARTLTVLARLDAHRKGSLLQFLYETNLINREKPIIVLGGFSMLNFVAGAADLKGIDLSFHSLENIDLSGTKLEGAHLAFCDLVGANLSEADLNEADLELSNLTNADLRFTVTGHTNLDGCTLDGADLESINLWDSSLREASLVRANLQGAYLAGSVFAAEIDEDLKEGSMGDAGLTGADLTEANLLNATITDEQLAQCASLEGATMPDGTVHD